MRGEGQRQALGLHSCAGCQPGRSGTSDGVQVCVRGVLTSQTCFWGSKNWASVGYTLQFPKERKTRPIQFLLWEGPVSPSSAAPETQSLHIMQLFVESSPLQHQQPPDSEISRPLQVPDLMQPLQPQTAHLSSPAASSLTVAPIP